MTMRPLRILVTACGAPGTVALLRALRANGEREVVLVGCDMSDRAVGRFLCDAFHRIPPGSSPLFPDAIARLCREERIDAVLPQSSHDLPGLASIRGELAADGTVALVSSPAAVAAAHDKASCYALLEAAGVLVPAWRRVRGSRELAKAAAELGYPARPVCAKPVVSSGSRGFHVIDPTADRRRELLDRRPGPVSLRLEEVAELLPEVGGDELLLMELLEGEERTVDGIATSGRLVLGLAKTRESVRAGLAMYFETIDHPELVEAASRAVGALGLDGFVNVQFVGDAVIEVNPRISTVVYQEDLNLPYLGLKLALGETDAEELAPYARRARATRRALRFFDQLEWDEEPPLRPAGS